MNSADLAPLLDYTLLAPDVTTERIAQACGEARQYQLAALSVSPGHVAHAASLLQGSDTRVGTLVGSSDNGDTRQKVYESATALEDGALEITMLMNVAALQSGDKEEVRRDILSVAQVVGRNPHAVLKAGADFSALSDVQQRLAVSLAIEGGAHFVVALPDDSGAPATTSEVALLYAVAGELIGLSVGGVRDGTHALALIAAGANCLGTENALALTM